MHLETFLQSRWLENHVPDSSGLLGGCCLGEKQRIHIWIECKEEPLHEGIEMPNRG